MYGLAYVIIPTEFSSLQAAIDAALAPFQRGGLDKFPRSQLAFNDMTNMLRALHTAQLQLRLDSGGVNVFAPDPEHVFHLDTEALYMFLKLRDASSWSGRLSNVEPDFDAFAKRFTVWKERDPDAGSYGQWLNPLGRWDWWELGGCYDGFITRAGKSAGRDAPITSGRSSGRDFLNGLARALGAQSSEREAETAANIELASALLEAAIQDERHAFPTAIVLPVCACAPKHRWLDASNWRLASAETKALLTIPDDALFKEAVIAAYERFHTMAVAAVAYHS
jgi:hypothetical protein